MFTCNHCELDLPRSSVWDDLCIHCNIMFLENDLEILRNQLKGINS